MTTRTDAQAGRSRTAGRPERPIGEIVHELIEDGKAYARAEVDLAKAIAAAKGKALTLPAALFGAAVHLCARRASGRSPSALSSRSRSFIAPLVGGLRRLADLRGHRRLARLVRRHRAWARPVTDTPEIAAARIEAERSRARLMATAHELQERLSPKTLARDAWEGAKEKGADLAEDAVDAVAARPVAATGVVAAIALFLARGPLMDLAGKLVEGQADEKSKAPQDQQGAKTQKKTKRRKPHDRQRQ